MISSGGEISLSLDIHTDAGLEFHSDVIFQYGNLPDPAVDQRFLKFCEGSGLLCNIVLQLVDSFYLLISFSGIDSGLFTELTESENLICNFIIGFSAVGLLDELLLQVLIYT